MTESVNIVRLFKIFCTPYISKQRVLFNTMNKRLLIFASEIWAKKIKTVGRHYFFGLWDILRWTQQTLMQSKQQIGSHLGV